MTRRTPVGVTAWLVAAGLFAVELFLGWTFSAQTLHANPLIPRASGEQCVAPTDFMRKNHMDVLLHQRDDTVIRGDRSGQFSLVACVNCHAQKDAQNQPIRIDAKGQFCASCHSYAAVKVDCFSCHAALPEVDYKAGLLLPWIADWPLAGQSPSLLVSWRLVSAAAWQTTVQQGYKGELNQRRHSH